MVIWSQKMNVTLLKHMSIRRMRSHTDRCVLRVWDAFPTSNQTIFAKRKLSDFALRGPQCIACQDVRRRIGHIQTYAVYHLFKLQYYRSIMNSMNSSQHSSHFIKLHFYSEERMRQIERFYADFISSNNTIAVRRYGFIRLGIE